MAQNGELITPRLVIRKSRVARCNHNHRTRRWRRNISGNYNNPRMCYATINHITWRPLLNNGFIIIQFVIEMEEKNETSSPRMDPLAFAFIPPPQDKVVRQLNLRLLSLKGITFYQKMIKLRHSSPLKERPSLILWKVLKWLTKKSRPGLTSCYLQLLDDRLMVTHSAESHFEATPRWAK